MIMCLVSLVFPVPMMNIFIQPYGKQMEMVFVQRVHVDKKDEMIQRRRKEVTN